jgi:acyl-CoA oxidase
MQKGMKLKNAWD